MLPIRGLHFVSRRSFKQLRVWRALALAKHLPVRPASPAAGLPALPLPGHHYPDLT
jgi:hypothetical protein